MAWNLARSINKFVKDFAKTDKMHGTLKAVLDASTKNNFFSVKDFGTVPGKLRKLSITYIPPICDTDGDCTVNVCDDGIPVGLAQVDFSIGKCTASRNIGIPIDANKGIDDLENREHMNNALMQLLSNARASLNKDIIAMLIAHVGLLSNGASTMVVPLLNTSGAYNPMGVKQIGLEFEKAQLNSPYIVGGDAVYLANQIQGMSGIDFNGRNLNAAPMTNWYYDDELNKAIANGKENLLAFDPARFKFIAWNENAGRFATSLTGLGDLINKYETGSLGQIRTTVYDPVSGLLWDLNGKYKDCPDEYVFHIKLHWDIFFLPENVCGNDGITGIMRFETCQIANTECPNVTPPTPVAKQDFCWTPDATCFPKWVQDLTLNGNGYTVATNVTSVADIAAVLSQASGMQFVLDGAKIKFNGFTAPTGSLQGVPFTFAACV